MADDIVTRIRDMATDHNRHRTHYDGCDKSHIECAALIAADEIERLREWLERTYRLAVGHGPNWMVFDGWEEAISAYEEARRG